MTPGGPSQGVRLGNSAALLHGLGSGACRMGNTKPKLIKPRSERAAASLTRAFAMQSSPAPARRGHLEAAGQAKIQPPPSRQTRSAWGRAFPELGVPGHLWLARALNHTTVQMASWVQGSLEDPSLFQPPPHAQTLGLFVQVCRTDLRQAARRARRGG